MSDDARPVWDESMSVGESTIDSQHESLIKQLNEIVDVLSSTNMDIGALRSSMHFLYTYINEHLSYEEKYMQDHGYPNFKKHKRIHEDFRMFFNELQEDFKIESSKSGFSTVEIGKLMEKIKEYLTAWIGHIKVADKNYANYISKNNVS